MRKLTLWLFALLAFVCTQTLFAQDISGTMSGTVLDPAGAAVPGAKVTITNTDRNQVVRTLTTDGSGSYSAPLIPVGTYSVKIEAQGFKAATRSDIKLNVSDDLKININLEVGNVSEQVTVEATPVAVELGTATSSTVINGTQIRELSIATRNYEHLVALMPGVTASQTDELYIGNSLPSGVANTLPFSINGNRSAANNWTIDGADNVDRGSNLTLEDYPSIDAIAEFRVLRSLYTADSGRAGGAQINVVTKSGTSAFHGDAYEFIRNDAFAANNWINNANSVNLGPDGKAKVPPLRYNDFGYTLGGPVFIPGHYNKDKNKTFFFFSEEFRRVITYSTLTSTLPTAAEQQGIFPTPVCLALSGSTCTQTGTQVTNINPIAQQYLKDIFSKVPAGGVNNTNVFAARNVFDGRQELARIDHTFNEKFSIFGRYTHDSIPTTEPGGIFGTSVIPNVATTNSNSPGQNVAIHAIYAIRPTLLNEVGYNYTYGAYLSTPVGLTAKGNSPDVNPNLVYPDMLGVIPAVGFTGGSSVVGVGPYKDYNRNHNAFDNVTWIKGRHTLKFGVSYFHYEKMENSPNGNNYGTFSFSNTGAPSGTASYTQAFANFLIGNQGLTYSQASADITPDITAQQFEAYAQDDFRVSSRLTVYYGVRYSFFGQPTDGFNRFTNFDPSVYKASQAPQINTANGLLVPGTGTPLTGFPGTVPLWSGLILNGVNSPYGNLVGNNSNKNFAPRVGIAWDPFGTGKTSIRSGYGIYYDSSLFGTYEQNILTNAPFVYSLSISNSSITNPSGGTASTVSQTTPLALHATPSRYNAIPYIQEWSFDIQRELMKNLVLDVGYFGSKGTHLIGIIDINQAPPGVALAAGLHTGAAGTTIFTTTDDVRINAVRPFQGYNAINTIEPWFNSNYHSLQLSIQKQFSANGLFQIAYTYSKNLTDNGSDRSNAPQSSYNFNEGEYGPAPLDRTHVFTANYVYKLPFFKDTGGAAGYLLKGWEISGITSYATGLPFTATTSSVDPAGLGLLGSSASSSRPDEVCNPNTNAPNTVAQWFNAACFQPVPQGQVRPGNAGRSTIRGPGFERYDFSLFKNFAFKERFAFQLRGEAFNIFNHPNPSGIGSTNITSSLYDKITSFRDPRILQIGAKLTF